MAKNIEINVFDISRNNKKKIFDYKGDSIKAGIDILNFKIGTDMSGLNLVKKPKA